MAQAKGLLCLTSTNGWKMLATAASAHPNSPSLCCPLPLGPCPSRATRLGLEVPGDPRSPHPCWRMRSCRGFPFVLSPTCCRKGKINSSFLEFKRLRRNLQREFLHPWRRGSLLQCSKGVHRRGRIAAAWQGGGHRASWGFPPRPSFKPSCSPALLAFWRLGRCPRPPEIPLERGFLQHKASAPSSNPQPCAGEGSPTGDQHPRPPPGSPRQHLCSTSLFPT